MEKHASREKKNQKNGIKVFPRFISPSQSAFFLWDLVAATEKMFHSRKFQAPVCGRVARFINSFQKERAENWSDPVL